MAFLLTCPNCGPRSAYEYRFGGEYNPRPSGPVSDVEWADYVYLRQNVCGEQVEWWFHRLGCRKWFMARRDTLTNAVLETYWPRGAPVAEEAAVARGKPEADDGGSAAV
jgi:sarcosine oxidase subunit delta